MNIKLEDSFFPSEPLWFLHSVHQSVGRPEENVDPVVYCVWSCKASTLFIKLQLIALSVHRKKDSKSDLFPTMNCRNEYQNFDVFISRCFAYWVTLIRGHVGSQVPRGGRNVYNILRGKPHWKKHVRNVEMFTKTDNWGGGGCKAVDWILGFRGKTVNISVTNTNVVMSTYSRKKLCLSYSTHTHTHTHTHTYIYIYRLFDVVCV